MRRFAVAVLGVAFAMTACGPRLGAVPSPSDTPPPICSVAPALGLAVDASYPSGALQNEQGMVPVVGMDRLVPLEPALEDFASAGIANASNVVTYSLIQAGSNGPVVRICRADGSVIVAEMYQPFPLSDYPIWAVRSYRVGR